MIALRASLRQCKRTAVPARPEGDSFWKGKPIGDGSWLLTGRQQPCGFDSHSFRNEPSRLGSEIDSVEQLECSTSVDSEDPKGRVVPDLKWYDSRPANRDLPEPLRSVFDEHALPLHRNPLYHDVARSSGVVA